MKVKQGREGLEITAPSLATQPWADIMAMTAEFSHWEALRNRPLCHLWQGWTCNFRSPWATCRSWRPLQGIIFSAPWRRSVGKLNLLSTGGGGSHWRERRGTWRTQQRLYILTQGTISPHRPTEPSKLTLYSWCVQVIGVCTVCVSYPRSIFLQPAFWENHIICLW